MSGWQLEHWYVIQTFCTSFLHVFDPKSQINSTPSVFWGAGLGVSQTLGVLRHRSSKVHLWIRQPSAPKLTDEPSALQKCDVLKWSDCCWECSLKILNGYLFILGILVAFVRTLVSNWRTLLTSTSPCSTWCILEHVRWACFPFCKPCTRGTRINRSWE